MRHLFRTTRSSDWMALLVLPAWLASGCDNESIRLGGWTAAPGQPAPPGTACGAPADRAGAAPAARARDGCVPPGGGRRAPAIPLHGMPRLRPARSGRLGLGPGHQPHDRQRDRRLRAIWRARGMWYRVAVRNDMPFNGTRLTPDEKGTLQSWIVGLQRPQPRPRTQAEILDLLVHDGTASGSGSDVRYVSFADFVDGRRPAVEIAAAGAVFKVILNSVSRRAALVEPVAVDRQGSIWRFRLSDLGWNEQDWSRFVTHYPYCLRSEAARPPGPVPASRHRDAVRARRLVPGHRASARRLSRSPAARRQPRRDGPPEPGRRHRPEHRAGQRRAPGQPRTGRWFSDRVLERHETSGGRLPVAHLPSHQGRGGRAACRSGRATGTTTSRTASPRWPPRRSGRCPTGCRPTS